MPTDPHLHDPVRILSLGDSYTIGEGVSADERWPVQLAARLREGWASGTGRRVADPVIVARTGWTVAELAEGVAEARREGRLATAPFHLVTLLVGVNDQYRGGGPPAYRDAFRQILATATTLAGGEPPRVVVLSIPDWGVTPFAAAEDRHAIARSIDAFNQVAMEEAIRVGAAWVEVTSLTREGGEGAAWLTDDGLHPSGPMYTRWAEAALAVVVRRLDETSAGPTA